MEKRFVLITGVCGGVGRATAQCFQDNGWGVIGVDRSEPVEDQDLDEFELVDISSSEQISDLFMRVGARHSELYALVNNAAVQINKPIIKTTDDDWTKIINTNVRSAFQCIREAHPLLKAAQGAIVNVASVHAVATSENIAVYGASKGAMVALTRSAALELAHDGIRCNSVLPGALDTPMLRDGLSRRPHPDGAAGNLRILEERTPLGFVATPEQIAPSIVHLADNDQSGYTTGQSLILDGGATIQLSTE